MTLVRLVIGMLAAGAGALAALGLRGLGPGRASMLLIGAGCGVVLCWLAAWLLSRLRDGPIDGDVVLLLAVSAALAALAIVQGAPGSATLGVATGLVAGTVAWLLARRAAATPGLATGVIVGLIVALAGMAVTGLLLGAAGLAAGLVGGLVAGVTAARVPGPPSRVAGVLARVATGILAGTGALVVAALVISLLLAALLENWTLR